MPGRDRRSHPDAPDPAPAGGPTIAVVERSHCASVRNPRTTRASFRALAALEPAHAAILRALLLELQADARCRAGDSWRRRKPPMAAYRAAVGVYAGHAARAFPKSAAARMLDGQARVAAARPRDDARGARLEFIPREVEDQTLAELRQDFAEAPGHDGIDMGI